MHEAETMILLVLLPILEILVKNYSNVGINECCHCAAFDNGF